MSLSRNRSVSESESDWDIVEMPILDALGGEWKLVESTDIDAFFENVTGTELEIAAWKRGTLHFKVDGKRIRSHFKIDSKRVLSTDVRLNEQTVDADGDVNLTTVKDEKLVTVLTSINDGEEDFEDDRRTEMHIHLGRLIVVDVVNRDVCKRVYEKVR